jgi:PKD repeat protein
MSTAMKPFVSLFLILILLVAPVSASIQVYKTPLNVTSPPGTERLTGGSCKIDYTATQPFKDPLKIQYKDLSKGTVTYVHWEFGDGSPCLYSKTGQKPTCALLNPVHTYKKKGYYITSYTIKTKEYKFQLWIHKTVIIK